MPHLGPFATNRAGPPGLTLVPVERNEDVEHKVPKHDSRTRAAEDAGMLAADEPTASGKWELPPVVTPRGESFGPRQRPQRGRTDPGGWRSGMPYGHQAWESYRRRDRQETQIRAPESA